MLAWNIFYISDVISGSLFHVRDPINVGVVWLQNQLQLSQRRPHSIYRDMKLSFNYSFRILKIVKSQLAFNSVTDKQCSFIDD